MYPVNWHLYEADVNENISCSTDFFLSSAKQTAYASVVLGDLEVRLLKLMWVWQNLWKIFEKSCLCYLHTIVFERPWFYHQNAFPVILFVMVPFLLSHLTRHRWNFIFLFLWGFTDNGKIRIIEYTLDVSWNASKKYLDAVETILKIHFSEDL